jgi:ankyrin repeat protein
MIHLIFQRFIEVQDWLAAGKPFRPISYRSAKLLRDAARTGFYSIIELFLRENLTQAELNEVLKEVVQLGREDLVKLLLESGAKATNDHDTFSRALWSGHPGIVRLFIEHGADLRTGSPFAWAFGNKPRHSLVGIFKDLIKKDPALAVQATQALNERIRARDEKRISLLLWIGANPRKSVDDLKIDDYKKTLLEQGARSGNLVFLEKAKIDPKRDNIVSLLDQAGRSPEPEIIEYLLSFSPKLSERLQSGRTILESYIRNLYYISDFASWVYRRFMRKS